MIATKVGAGVDPLPSDRYVCSRCGVERECTSSRSKPEHCADCVSVLKYRPPELPEVDPVLELRAQLTDDECRAARNALREGDRSPGVEEAAREYWRRAGIAKRNRKAAS